MKKLLTAATFAAMLAVPQKAHGAAFWNQQCTNGGWTFNTCASAWVDVGGANNNIITLRIWNLAGLPGTGTFNNAGFTAIGLGNIGSGLVFQNLVATRVGGGGYGGWSFATGGGGIPGPVGSSGVVINGVNDAIFSQWATNIPGNGNPAITNWAGPNQFGNGYVQFQFGAYTQVCTGNGNKRVCTLAPAQVNLTNAVLGLHVQSGPNGQSTGYECVANGGTASLNYPCYEDDFGTNSVPEPMTMVLMATGLVGLGAVQLRRRSKQS